MSCWAAMKETMNPRSGDIDTSCSSVVDEVVAKAMVCSKCDTPAKETRPTGRPRTGSHNHNGSRKETTATKNKSIELVREKSDERGYIRNSTGEETKTRRKRQENSNRRLSFPEKLMALMRSCTNESTANNKKQAAPVRWLPDGKSFEVVSIHQFTLEVLPHFFGQTEYSSFTRKLYFWGFKKVRLDCDAFYHDLFMRDDPKQCSKIRARRSGYHEYVLPGESSLQGTNENAQLRKQSSPSVRTSATSKRECPALASRLSLSKRLRWSGDERNLLRAPSGDSSSADDICLRGLSAAPPPRLPLLPSFVFGNQNLAFPCAEFVALSLPHLSSSTTTRYPIIDDRQHLLESNTKSYNRSKIGHIAVAEERRVSVVSTSANTPACALSVALADKQEEFMRKFRTEWSQQERTGDQDAHSDLATSMPLRIQEETILLKKASHQEEQQKLLAAAALLEIDTMRKAQEFQRQQLEAKSHAAATAAMVLDAAGLVPARPKSEAGLHWRKRSSC